MGNLDNKTAGLITEIRANASLEFQNRIPETEQISLAELGSSILSEQSSRNEFITALVNKVAFTIIRENFSKNPMAVFKGEQLQFGDKVEDIIVELVKAQVFDQKTAESELYKREKPEVSVLYHHIPRKGFYKTTTDESQLRKAFTSERAFRQLLASIVEQLSMSREYDDFLVAKSLLTQAITEGKVAEVVAPPISDTATAKKVLKEIKKAVKRLTFISDKYNYAGSFRATKPEDIRIIMDIDVETEIGVEVLAGAFNLSEVDYEAQRIVIDNFDELASDVHCIIADKKWLVLHDYPEMADTLWNPQGRYWNHFLHYESINSTTHFANAVAIKKQASVLSSIDLRPATANVVAGNVVQFTVEATGTNNPSSKSTFAVTGNSSADTFISSTGLLFVDSDETGTAGDLTITATAEQDNLITDTSIVTIV